VTAVRSSASRAALFATICAVTLIAVQVGGKATRDAMFLSTFGIAALPTMLMISAVIAVASIPLAARAMTAFGPSRLVPAAFAASAALLLGEWAAAREFPRVSAIAVYLHVGSLGSVLVSWFWSLINERFDPRTAKRYVARIAGGATVGGLLGGVMAERLSGVVAVVGMLPILAAMHVACGALTFGLKKGPAPATPPSPKPIAATRPPAARASLSLLWRSPYIRDLALVVSLCAIGAALLDFAFKAAASAAYARGQPLLHFFGIFYAATGLATLLVQATITRRFLERFGLAPTAASLPATLGVAGVAALLAPAVWCLAIARGAEAAVRSSLFRSGYELFYTPIPPAEKRAVKTMIDVGGERLGDLAGGGIVKLLLVLVPAVAGSVMLGLAVALGLVGLLIALRLHRGYMRTLERSLLDRAVELEIGHSLDQTTRGVILRTRPDLTAADLSALGRVPAAPPPRPAPPPELDPFARRAAALRSGDRDRVRAALDAEPLTPALVPIVVPLLAWDDVASRAIEALRAIAGSVIGQLTDALLDPEAEFTIRRRLPRVLSASDSPRAIDALLAGLDDRRFETRYQCGRALARIHARVPERAIPEERVHAAVLREVAVDRGVWESQRLLDRSEEATDSEFVDQFLRDRANRSLEHVFTLLSLTLPKQPLIVAFRGLHTSDEALRGTALEYLEGMLPERIRQSVWPFLEDKRGVRHPSRPRAEILAELMRSNASIDHNLKALRDQLVRPGPSTTN
jgi:ATP:ADP antiporter, AAA family